MKILALDIGSGTEDILLYEDGINVENCIKLVLPSPSRVYASKVKSITRNSKDLFITGDIIGGGYFSDALRTHLSEGLDVIISENAAYTVRNDLEDVKRLGIKITKEDELKNFDGVHLNIEEVNLKKLRDFLGNFGEDLSTVDVVTVGVQDHGVSPKGISDRSFRINWIKNRLEYDNKPESLAFNEVEIPSFLLRMKSAVKASKRQLPNAKVVVMDTAPAAILGCLLDPVSLESDPLLIINVGNGHTMIAIISKGQIKGILEHHTSLLEEKIIEKIIIDFSNGKLTNKEVFNRGGHGLFYLGNPPGFSNVEKIIATGPRRSILSKTKLETYFAAPAGDVMMTGPIGLIEAAKKKYAC
jgi:uncharacterized protein (DUF1786 family)